jgi:hypothetical protein
MKKILQPYGSSRRLLPLLSFFGHAYIGCELTFNKKKGRERGESQIKNRASSSILYHYIKHQ